MAAISELKFHRCRSFVWHYNLLKIADTCPVVQPCSVGLFLTCVNTSCTDRILKCAACVNRTLPHSDFPEFMSEGGLCVNLRASFLLQSLDCSLKATLALCLLLLLRLFFFLDEIRSLGSCPALSFACCLPVACYFFQHHLTRGSFNLQGLRTADTREGEGEQLLEDT